VKTLPKGCMPSQYLDSKQRSALLEIDDATMDPLDEHSSSTELTALNLSQYIFLNPVWLSVAVTCVVRQDLNQELSSLIARSGIQNRGDLYPPTFLNYPTITAEEAAQLWRVKNLIYNAAKRCDGTGASDTGTNELFQFLESLFVAFNIFIPMDSGWSDGRFNGQSRIVQRELPVPHGMAITRAGRFMLPSLVDQGAPENDVWTYKSSKAYTTTLAVSWLLPDIGGSSHLMERVTACVLRNIYGATSQEAANESSTSDETPVLHNAATSVSFDPFRVDETVGKLCVEAMHVWRTAILFQFSTKYVSEQHQGGIGKSFVEVFVHLVDQANPTCVGSNSMVKCSKKLIASAKGPHGQWARKIWKGG
jgi:hypothetical protein